MSTDSKASWLVHALIGGLTGLFLSFLPFSSVLCGALASYLQGGTPRDGLKIGAVAGLIMLVPFGFLLFFAVLVFGFVSAEAGVFFLSILLVVLFIAALYTVGGSAIGGYLGIYLQDELDTRQRR